MKLPDRDSEHLVFGLLFLLSNKLQTLGDTFFEEVTTKQWFILLVLKILSGNEPTLNELSDAAGSSRQNVKQIILKLEKKGFVELRKDETDGRKFRIKMTPKCEEFSNAYAQKSIEFMKKLFANIDETDLNTTLKTLNRLQENLERMENEYV
ncbi:MarR family transcriptional regulator [Mobilitalea sibirica]|uniref:MarR family transcriptional regulator n=1 Tax=Mobilitalea sibirica TaxID=1462919 RepID=A0A8J7H0S2_9FIRM|nr:MarR family transcriptional regulator [Mobilitalea sibirica]MBH1942114.1 MarR family transcriptional regulator [Mobilitalea sibirica]